MLRGYSARGIRIVSPKVSVAKNAFGTCSNGVFGVNRLLTCQLVMVDSFSLPEPRAGGRFCTVGKIDFVCSAWNCPVAARTLQIANRDLEIGSLVEVVLKFFASARR